MVFMLFEHEAVGLYPAVHGGSNILGVASNFFIIFASKNARMLARQLRHGGFFPLNGGEWRMRSMKGLSE